MQAMPLLDWHWTESRQLPLTGTELDNKHLNNEPFENEQVELIVFLKNMNLT